MNLSSLLPDDLPLPASDAEILCQQLELAISKLFYEACDGVTQALLMKCEWSMTTRSHSLTLTIACPDLTTNGRVLNHLVAITTYLEPFTSSAKIRICPPLGTGTPLEIQVNEVSVYGDLF